MNIYVLEQWNKTHVVQLYDRRLTEIYWPKKIKSVIWTQPNPLDDWNLWPNPTRSKRPNQTQSSGWTQPHGRPHMGANGVSWPPGKMAEKLKSENMQKSRFLRLCYILRAIRAGRCRERRYADHIFIQIYSRMNHFVVKFSKFPSPQAARGHWPP